MATARTYFADKPYVSLENLDILEFARQDTRGFRSQYQQGAIIDEAQRYPELFSYLQQIIDEGPKTCRFILTGSQQFGLRSPITQTLAGRVANCTLLPFSLKEWFDGQETIGSLDHLLFTGLYPPIYDRKLDPSTKVSVGIYFLTFKTEPKKNNTKGDIVGSCKNNLGPAK